MEIKHDVERLFHLTRSQQYRAVQPETKRRVKGYLSTSWRRTPSAFDEVHKTTSVQCCRFLNFSRPKVQRIIHKALYPSEAAVLSVASSHSMIIPQCTQQLSTRAHPKGLSASTSLTGFSDHDSWTSFQSCRRRSVRPFFVKLGPECDPSFLVCRCA